MDFTFYKQERSKTHGISDGDKCYGENKARKEASGVIVGRVIMICRVIRESLILIGTFEPRDEGREGLDYADD